MNLTLRAVGDRKDLAPQVYQAYAAEYARNSRVLSAPYPGIADMLRALHQAGMRLCVLSNKDDPDARDVIRYYFPDQPFALVRGRLPDVPIKPDPTAALAIVRELGLSARDFWYVGDTRTDMRCAKNAGMDSIAVTWGFQKKEEIAPGEPGEYAASVEELTRRLLS